MSTFAVDATISSCDLNEFENFYRDADTSELEEAQRQLEQLKKKELQSNQKFC